MYGMHATRTVRGQVRFKTYLRDAGGLDADTSVLFGGIKVGRITAVRPDTDDPTRIEIAFEVKAGTPVNGQSKARVGTVSLMGTPALQITTGSNEAPRLAPGAVVAFYTDGLIERRGESLDVGFERLREAVSPGAPDRVAHEIMRHLIGGSVPADDIALVVARRTDAPAGCRT
jgi:hypothetical protein